MKIPNITYKEGADVENVKKQIQTSVSEYLKTISLGGVIRIVKIEAAIGSVSDVIGFDDVLVALEGGTSEYVNADIQLVTETKTTLGEVTYI